MDERADDALVRSARQGAPCAFRRLVEVYSPVAWRTALVFLKDRHRTEDALQEAWLDVWRGLPRFRAGKPFRPWLVTLVANRCRKAGRQAGYRDVPLDVDTVASAQAPDAEQPEMQALRAETLDTLRQVLASLALEQQQVLELRYFADLDLAEIAAATGVPVGTVKSRLHRALQALRATRHTERLAMVHEEGLA